MVMKELYERIFIIHKCGGCREILDYEFFGEALCPECRLKWSMAGRESCPLCGQSAVECTCMPRELAKQGALCLHKLYFYSDKKDKEPQNKLLYFLKKNPNKRVADFVAKELFYHVQAELSVLDLPIPTEMVLIVNVPRGHASRRLYGFDQSAFVCRRLSLLSGVEYLPAIKRKRGGKEQKTLGVKKRFKNVETLFYIKEPEAVRDKYIILFDDVVTTGASMAACTAVLKKAGARGVICLSVAQVSKNTKK